MPDFLTSIARRTLGVAPVAQPIIAPMYAPKPASFTSTPAFLEEEAVLEVSPMTHKARRSSSAPAPQHTSSAARSAQQSIVSPEQPPPRTTDSPVRREEPSTGQMSERVVPASPPETNDLLYQEVESARPVAPTSMSTQLEEESTTNTLIRAGASPLHLQMVRAGEASPIAQRASLERYEDRLITHAGVQERPIQPVSISPAAPVAPAQPHNRPLRKANIEYLLSRPDHASSQFDIQDVAQQAPSPQGISRLFVPKTPTSPKREAALPWEQDLLVPDTTNKVGKLVEQRTAHTQTNGLVPVYVQDVFPTGRHASVESPHARAVESHPTGSAEAPLATPTIRVTIGRIDVRAVTSSSPPTRPKPIRSGPTLSLEDYARQNRGGR